MKVGDSYLAAEVSAYLQQLLSGWRQRQKNPKARVCRTGTDVAMVNGIYTFVDEGIHSTISVVGLICMEGVATKPHHNPITHASRCLAVGSPDHLGDKPALCEGIIRGIAKTTKNVNHLYLGTITWAELDKAQ